MLNCIWRICNGKGEDFCREKNEAPCSPSRSARRFKFFYYALVIYIHLLMFPWFPSLPLRRSAKLSNILNNPSSARIEELHADGKAVALHRLAVGHPGRGTKLSGTRNNGEPVIKLPAARTDYPRASFADVFRKCGFGTGRLPVAFEIHADFHGDAALGAIVRMDLAGLFAHGLVHIL